MISNKLYLIRHKDHAIKRHINVNGNRSPCDGDWPYWGNRLSKLPGKSPRVIKLLKLQQGKCNYRHPSYYISIVMINYIKVCVSSTKLQKSRMIGKLSSLVLKSSEKG
ncbi:MAG: hypothetical protein PV340_02765 [Wolbachia sp.]|nr:hypothetical protein [Wolbachia sp.]MDD9336762.1 hypothetical protein [Wolbachia sp.]